jgi:hypothetical protein
MPKSVAFFNFYIQQNLPILKVFYKKPCLFQFLGTSLHYQFYVISRINKIF